MKDFKEILEKLGEDPKALIAEFVLYSVKKHHGGNATRLSRTQANSRALRKANFFASAGSDWSKFSSDFNDEDADPKTTAGEDEDDDEEVTIENHSRETAAYGHRGSTNVMTIGYCQVTNSSDLLSKKAYLGWGNALNTAQNMAMDDKFDLSGRIEDYNKAKAKLIKDYSRNGVIPDRNRQTFNRHLAELAFVYYEHHFVLRFFTTVPIVEGRSRQILGEELYCTEFKSRVWHTGSLLDAAWVNSIAGPQDEVTVKCSADTSPLYVISRDGKLYLSRKSPNLVQDPNSDEGNGYT